MSLSQDFCFYIGNKPTHQAVYEALRDAIVSGRISVGERLIEMDYARVFNVSRTPIRTALQKLVKNGLVTALPSGGVEVKGFALDGIDNVFKLQQALEHLAFPQVIMNITPEELQSLMDNIATIETLLDRDLLKAAHLNENVHRTLFQLSRFEGIMEAVDLAYGFVQGFNLLAAQDLERQIGITAEHHAIIDALASGDVALLTSVADFHLEACRMYATKHYYTARP